MGNTMSRVLRDLDRIGNFFNRIRSVLIVILLICFAGSVARNGCTRSEFTNLLRETTGLNVENALLMDEVNARDSILIAKDEVIAKLEAAIDRSETSVSKLVDHYTRLYTRYATLADSITQIPGDSSYSYLNKTAYPLPGIKKFPFSEKQVNAMHLTYVEHTSLSLMHGALKDRIHELNEQKLLRDSIITERTAQVDTLRVNQSELEQIVMNQLQQVDMLTTHIKKEKKQNRIWKIAGGIIIVILAAIAAFGG